MAFERDIYYEALLQRLQDRVPGVMTWTRKAMLAESFAPSMQPAGVLLVANQSPAMERSLPTVWTLGADLFLLVRSTGQKESLDTVLNGLVDDVEAALLRDAEDPVGSDPVHTTLGGLVQSVKIAGPIDFRQGEGGEQAEVFIPLDMLVIGDVPGIP